MTAMANLGSLWNSIQAWLFPTLEDELGELDEKYREFIPSVSFARRRQTWINLKGLSDDERDLGYPRLLKRNDGHLVAIYYWSTKEHPYHISATIWKP